MPGRDLRFSIDRGGTFTDVFVEVHQFPNTPMAVAVMSVTNPTRLCLTALVVHTVATHVLTNLVVFCRLHNPMAAANKREDSRSASQPNTDLPLHVHKGFQPWQCTCFTHHA